MTRLRQEVDANVLFETRAAMRGSLLVDGPRTEVLLVRHAQQSFTPEARAAGGMLGPRLSDTGEVQAGLVAEYLASEPIAAVYCSHLHRAAQTAQAIVQKSTIGGDPVVRGDLREVEVLRRPNDGAGMVVEPKRAADFFHTRSFDSLPDTEPSATARTRLVAELGRIAHDHPRETVVAVAHGGAISAFLADLLGSAQDMFFFAAHASVTRVFASEGRWAIHTVNELDHLRRHDLVTF
jgi:2,3-bisphosphoglycerate-dependent phosphoglycerate mutase